MRQTEKEIRAKAPKRPYANFDQFCAKQHWLGRTPQATGQYPCLDCRGRGWQYDPDSQPDPCEGNKFRDTVTCDTCLGSRKGSRKACFAKYSETITRWKTETLLFQTNIKRRRKALSKLTVHEIEALQELGI